VVLETFWWHEIDDDLDVWIFLNRNKTTVTTTTWAMGNGQWATTHIGCKDTLGFETKCDLTCITFFWNIIVHYYCLLLSSLFFIIIIIITMTRSTSVFSVHIKVNRT